MHQELPAEDRQTRSRIHGESPPQVWSFDTPTGSEGSHSGNDVCGDYSSPAEADPDLLWLKPHVALLRHKVSAAGGPAILALRGVGYRLELP
jgi:hypothetical protein